MQEGFESPLWANSKCFASSSRSK